MSLDVTSAVLARILSETAAAHPLECCGILLGEGGAILEARPARNVHSTPETHFDIDPAVLIDAHRAARAGGPRLAGYYHSHPTGAPEPSATDRAQAAHDGRVWAIAAEGEVRFWRDDETGFVPLSYTAIIG